MKIPRGFILWLRRAYIRVLSALFWLLLIFALDSIGVAIATLVSAVIHEAGHLFAARCFCARGKIKSGMQGLKMSFSRGLSYREELICAAFGPLSNILVFLLSYLLPQGWVRIFGLVNLFTGLSNLIPVSGYDGERMLSAILCPVIGPYRTERAIFYLSAAFSVLLAFLSLYIMAKVGTGFWIYFIFLSVFIGGMKRDGKIFFARKREKTEENKRKRELC